MGLPDQRPSRSHGERGLKSGTPTHAYVVEAVPDSRQQKGRETVNDYIEEDGSIKFDRDLLGLLSDCNHLLLVFLLVLVVVC